MNADSQSVPGKSLSGPQACLQVFSTLYLGKVLLAAAVGLGHEESCTIKMSELYLVDVYYQNRNYRSRGKKIEV